MFLLADDAGAPSPETGPGVSAVDSSSMSESNEPQGVGGATASPSTSDRSCTNGREQAPDDEDLRTGTEHFRVEGLPAPLPRFPSTAARTEAGVSSGNSSGGCPVWFSDASLIAIAGQTAGDG